MAKKPDNSGKKLETAFKSGDDWKGNRSGRPKGSRNKFAEKFLADFLRDWELNGKAAIRKVRKLDPVAYLKTAAQILPKDFNVSVSSEEDLEKMLEQYDDEQLEAIFAAISAANFSNKKGATKEKAGSKSNSVH